MTDESDGPDDREWPPSNYPILLAILLLVGAAIALVVSTEAVANQLATYAYYALVVGVVLRLVEQAGGDRLQTALSDAFATVWNATRIVRNTLRALWRRD